MYVKNPPSSSSNSYVFRTKILSVFNAKVFVWWQRCGASILMRSIQAFVFPMRLSGKPQKFTMSFSNRFSLKIFFFQLLYVVYSERMQEVFSDFQCLKPQATPIPVRKLTEGQGYKSNERKKQGPPLLCSCGLLLGSKSEHKKETSTSSYFFSTKPQHALQGPFELVYAPVLLPLGLIVLGYWQPLSFSTQHANLFLQIFFLIFILQSTSFATQGGFSSGLLEKPPPLCSTS